MSLNSNKLQTLDNINFGHNQVKHGCLGKCMYVVLRRTVVQDDIESYFDNLSTSHLQSLKVTMKMTSATCMSSDSEGDFHLRV